MVLILGMLSSFICNGATVTESSLDINHGIEYRTHTWCDTWILTIDGCSAAAIELGLTRPGVVATDDGFSKAGYDKNPPVCEYSLSNYIQI